MCREAARLVVAVMAAFAAGCGGGDEEPSSPPAAESDKPAEIPKDQTDRLERAGRRGLARHVRREEGDDEASDGDDILIGTEGKDVVAAGGGDDRIETFGDQAT